MKKMFMIFMLAVVNLYTTPADLKLPDFANGIYDQFGQNFISSSMVGRGHTGISVKGNIGSAIHNPAAFHSNSLYLSMDLLLKFPTDEFNLRYYNSDNEYIINSRPLTRTDNEGGTPGLMDVHDKSYRYQNTYQSTTPFSFIGVGLPKFINNINLGLSYNLNRSIRYEDYKRINFIKAGRGYQIVRQPSLNEYQYTLTANWTFRDFTVGANAIMIHQSYREYRLEGLEDNRSFSEFIYRGQVGFLYELEKIQFGLTYKPQVKKTLFSLDYPLPTTFPNEASFGVSYTLTEGNVLLFDADYIRYSESAAQLNDQITLKFGFEKTMKDNTNLTVGLIHKPSIFSGEYYIRNYGSLQNFSDHDASDFNLKNIPAYGVYDKIDLLYFTMGLSANLNDPVKINLAMMHNLTKDTKITQIMAGFEVDLSILNNRN